MLPVLMATTALVALRPVCKTPGTGRDAGATGP
jgi:hypothetical protein